MRPQFFRIDIDHRRGVSICLQGMGWEDVVQNLIVLKEKKNTLSVIHSNFWYGKACHFSLLYSLFRLVEVGLHHLTIA